MLGKKVSLIVAVNSLGYIDNGKNGLPWDKHFEPDMERFREITLNKIVVMGMNTYKSIGGPLKNRINIVFTTNQNVNDDPEKELYFCRCNDEFNIILSSYCTGINDVVVIGGKSIYNMFRQQYDTIYITEVLKNNTIGTIKFNYPPQGNSGWAIVEKKTVSDELRFITLANTTLSNTPKFL